VFFPPDVMLLDEPTNHLDVDAILWLEGRPTGEKSGGPSIVLRRRCSPVHEP
jgi:ATPase subunit of ABC transporter with duplicated ATPase domains